MSRVCGAEDEAQHTSDCRYIGNLNRKWTDNEIDPLANLIWRHYIQAQPVVERPRYRQWCALTDGAVVRGVRAIARMMIKMGVRPHDWDRVAVALLEDIAAT
jgi:hypothetical protein